MENYITGEGIPLAFGMELSRNRRALEHFAAMAPARRREIIRDAMELSGSQEIRRYVKGLAGQDTFAQ